MLRNMVAIGFLFLFAVSTAQEIRSPLNGHVVPVDSNSNESYFIVSAHFYGGEHNKAGFPASTLLGNLGEINSSGAALVACSGDLFQDVKTDIPRYEKALFSQLKVPLFNAVGNHDVSGNVYTENYGATWHAFTWNGDRFVFLDTEIDDSSITGEQAAFLQQELANAQTFRNLFIFSHRPVWAEEDEVMSGLFKHNTRSSGSINFKSEMLPLLEAAQEKCPVYWFSGSMGGVPVSFFYHQVEGQQLYFIQTAIRDLPRDAMLHVRANDSGVKFETVALGETETEPLENYTIDYWLEFRPPAEFNWRLIPFWTKTMATHRFFWYGVGYTLFFLFVGRWFIKRRKRKRSKN